MKKKIILALVVIATIVGQLPMISSASSCTDVEVIFARGSGSALGATDYSAFYNALTGQLAGSSLNYHFYELGTSAHDGHQYPAVAVGTENMDNILHALGAIMGSGESYKYGQSVNQGVLELKAYTQEILAKCPNTKFVLAGYSQGAQVISAALPILSQDAIIYAATFGDPKLYLPEGKGLIPAACRDEGKLSPYRAYVPDCYAYQGILGGTNPYQPSSYNDGKVGTWCLYSDIMCSAHIDLSDPIKTHLSYKSEGMYDSAAKVIVNKLAAAFPTKTITQTSLSDYDVIFMLDTTGSMSSHIQKYKQRAIELAEKVVSGGGRVGLYDYRDLSDGYHAKKRCELGNCSLAEFQAAVGKLNVGGGGDTPESLLASLKETMNDASWQKGAKKAMVVLTDATFLNPDRDATTLEDVVQLSRSIDPVHIYVLAPESYRSTYQGLTSSTYGSFFSLEEEIDLSTEIVSNNLTIPTRTETPTAITNLALESLSTNSVKLTFTTDAARVYVALNDTILGFTEANEITLIDLDRKVDNTITLVPYSATGFKGETTSSVIRFIAEDSKNNSTKPEDIKNTFDLGIPQTGQN